MCSVLSLCHSEARFLRQESVFPNSLVKLSAKSRFLLCALRIVGGTKGKFWKRRIMENTPLSCHAQPLKNRANRSYPQPSVHFDQ